MTAPVQKVTVRADRWVVVEKASFGDDGVVIFTAPDALGERDASNACMAWIYRDIPAIAAIFDPRVAV